MPTRPLRKGIGGTGQGGEVVDGGGVVFSALGDGDVREAGFVSFVAAVLQRTFGATTKCCPSSIDRSADGAAAICGGVITVGMSGLWLYSCWGRIKGSKLPYLWRVSGILGGMQVRAQ